MLKSLHIENYVLIDSLDITFPEGLIIITGQTGAGKSILLGAMSLLTGAKADASLISEGADSLVVVAEFDVKDTSGVIERLLEEADAEYDDGTLLIRRVVHRSGRSRSFINDSPVAVGVLAELASFLIDIHSQHQNMLLAKSAFQLSLLDYFAGAHDLCEKCGSEWDALREAEKELAETKEELARNRANAEYNHAQWEQLDNAKLRDGELEELEREQRELASAEQIKELLTKAGDAAQACQELKDAHKALEKVEQFWDGAGELAERMESARIELEDIFYEIDKKNSAMGVSGERLEAVEDRISLLLGLMRKHGADSVEALIQIRDNFSRILSDSSELEFKEEELTKKVEKCRKEYLSTAQRLHDMRAKAAPHLSEELERSIRALELEKAVFRVELSECACGERGMDSCLFLFDSNGNHPSELSKCASGGELSRIMLCIKEMMARFANMPTMIFDEIDTGVSGSVAHKMGQMICKMGHNMQVFAITHLPQVAAKGDAHYVVRKSEKGGRVTSTLSLLSDADRVQEIARLLSGESVTPEALANAESLLQQR